MNKIIFILLITTTSLIYSQNWSYKSGGSAFDGKYKTASIIGEGTDYPYNKPILVINLYKEESLNFYISNSGFYQSLADIEILWIFDNEPNIIYKSHNFTKSKDGKVLFLDDFKNSANGDYLWTTEFIEKFKYANKVDVRIKNNSGKNDISFSLSGSAKAINYVISKKYKEKEIAYRSELEKVAIEELNEKIEISGRVLTLLLRAGIKDDKEWVDMNQAIEDTFKYYNIEMSEIDSLNIDTSSYSTRLKLYNKDGELINEMWGVESVIPKYVKDNKDSEFQENYDILASLIKDYNFNENEKNIVTREINDNCMLFKIDIKEIDSIEIDWIYLDVSAINFNLLNSNISVR